MVKFLTNTSGTTYNWPNLELKQVTFYLAGEITQVIDSIPWVRCASGNVLVQLWISNEIAMRRPSNDAVATWTPVSHILCLHLLVVLILIKSGF